MLFKSVLKAALILSFASNCIVDTAFCAPDDSAKGTTEELKVGGALPALKELVTSPFGMRNSHRRWQATGLRRLEHRGVDIKALKGWPVIAFKGGEIIQAGPAGPAGILAKVRQEDGMTTAYAHLDSVIVKNGQKVTKGEVLGFAGCTGRTTGSHLHLAMRNEKGEFVDPLLYVKNATEVLKPSPEQIPEKITSEACRRTFFYGGRRSGRSFSMQQIRDLERSAPPPIPVWPGR